MKHNKDDVNCDVNAKASIQIKLEFNMSFFLTISMLRRCPAL